MTKKPPEMVTESAPGLLIAMSLRMLPVATPIATPAVMEKLNQRGSVSCVKPRPTVMMRSSSSDDLLTLSPMASFGIGGSYLENRRPSDNSIASSRHSAIFDHHLSCDDTVLAKKNNRLRAKNVRNVLSIFKRRNSEVPSSIPSVEVIESWAHNFINLLKHEYGLKLFKSFLCSEYSEENIEFWIACEEYKMSKTKLYAEKAQKIYSDFVTVHAPKEVNLDSKTRLETMKNLNSPDKMTFELAQVRIQCLMEKDSYPRFLRSHFYTDLLSRVKRSVV